MVGKAKFILLNRKSSCLGLQGPHLRRREVPWWPASCRGTLRSPPRSPSFSPQPTQELPGLTWCFCPKIQRKTPGQERVWLQILEGEQPWAKDNHVVGQLHVELPKADHRRLLEVVFDLDAPRICCSYRPWPQGFWNTKANDVLHVTASDLGALAGRFQKKRCDSSPTDGHHSRWSALVT